MPELAALIEDEFPLRPDLIHFNHAAVAPWPRRTVDAVQRFAEENAYQGSWDYPAWLETETRLRQRLARLINAPAADDIALLKSTSEGLSLVAHGLDWRPGDNIVTSDEEFPSNRIVWESLASMGVELRQASLRAGDSPEASLLGLVDERTRLLAISSVEYASGARLDLEVLGRACRRREILFCVDAIQSLGALQFDVQAVGADFVAADGHKWLLGPEGLALFYCRAELREQLQLHQFGWHMVEHAHDFDRREWSPAASARRFECGSPNMLGIHALEASLSLLEEIGIAEVERRVLDNTRYLIERCDANPRLERLTPAGHFAGIFTFRHRKLDADALFSQLKSAGVFCAQRGGGVRFSPHFHTPRRQLAQVMELLERV